MLDELRIDDWRKGSNLFDDVLEVISHDKYRYRYLMAWWTMDEDDED